MNFADYIFENTRESDGVAYICDGLGHAYRDTYRRVLGYEALIRGLGAAAPAEAAAEPPVGMRFIAVVADNSGFFIEAYFAAIKSGRVCVPLNPAASARELEYVAGACKPEAVFVQKRRAREFGRVFSSARAIFTEDSLAGDAPESPAGGVGAVPAGAGAKTPPAPSPAAAAGTDSADAAKTATESGAATGTDSATAASATTAATESGAAAGTDSADAAKTATESGAATGTDSAAAASAATAATESGATAGAVAATAAGAPPKASPIGSGGDDIAVVLFTSGSTGDPKGVMLSHGNLRHNTESIVEYLGIGPSERALVVLPFFYCFGTSVLHTHFRAGASVALNNEFMFPETVGEYINKYGCTSFSGVPGTYQILLRKSGFASGKYPTLRYVAQAGGKLSPVFIKELIAALPGVRIVIMYGQTEATSRLSYLPPELLERKMGSIGKGIPGTELRVENERGDCVKPGEIGQIVARGGNVMKGYLGDPDATGAVLRDGALHTGDLATVDGDGFIYVAGREKQIIKHAGYRISPKEIEDVILGMGEVLEAVVFGVEDELLGEAPKAVVALKGGPAAGARAGAGAATGTATGVANARPGALGDEPCATGAGPGARAGAAGTVAGAAGAGSWAGAATTGGPIAGTGGAGDKTGAERAWAGAAAERIMARCRERLPSYKVPTEIEIAEGGLPKNAAGKLLFAEIKAKYGRARSARNAES